MMETSIGVNKAILHILDFNSNLTVFSAHELELGKSSVAEFLMKHIEKAYCNPGAKPAAFNPDSRFRELLDYAHKLHLAGIPHDSALKQTLAYARKRK